VTSIFRQNKYGKTARFPIIQQSPQPVETTGSRTRLNIMGALNLNDIGSTVVREYHSINSLNIARFFIAIRETYPVRKKVHIILDGAGYHRADLVKEWEYVMNIDLHYLPPYNPNLGRDSYLLIYADIYISKNDLLILQSSVKNKNPTVSVNRINM
jgi:hypothetical protein